MKMQICHAIPSNKIPLHSGGMCKRVQPGTSKTKQNNHTGLGQTPIIIIKNHETLLLLLF